MGRTAGAEVTQQQRLMMRIGPLLYVFFALVSPLAIGIYFLVSTLWRSDNRRSSPVRSIEARSRSAGRRRRPWRRCERRKSEGNGPGRPPPAKKAPTEAPSGNGRTTRGRAVSRRQGS